MSAADDLRGVALTRDLTDEQLADLVAAGHEVEFGPDEELFQEGAPAEMLWILLDGQIELSRRIANQKIVVATMSNPGQWAGGLAAWGGSDTGAAGYRGTGRALTAGRCFVVPSGELSRLIEDWLPFGKHIIVGVFNTVRSIDATARERESLVALGNIAAGLAHEINNPAAASLRAVEALRATADFMLASLASLAEHSVHTDQFLALDRLRVELQQRTDVDESAIATADREELIGTWLENRDVEHAWQMAGVLASVGIDEDWFERVEAVVGPESVGPAMRWISSTIGAGNLLNELSDTTRRISNLVDGVREYSQLDRAALQTADLHAGIESTLVMLAWKLGGIEVTRDFAADLPEIEVYASELNQVWNNLIDNAIDAMDGTGTLHLATRVDGDHVVVEVTDSGHGMPDEVQARAFEPFFTTKDVGKGTGLGLDISHRIVVDRHGGDITFDSQPGRTTAQVRLPLRR